MRPGGMTKLEANARQMESSDRVAIIAIIVLLSTILSSVCGRFVSRNAELYRTQRQLSELSCSCAGTANILTLLWCISPALLAQSAPPLEQNASLEELDVSLGEGAVAPGTMNSFIFDRENKEVE